MGGTVSDDRAVAGPPASAREERLPRLEIALGLATVAYLAAEGIRAAAGLAGRRLGARAVPVVAGAAVAAIAVWNVAMAWDYVDRGRRVGDDIGSTGR